MTIIIHVDLIQIRADFKSILVPIKPNLKALNFPVKEVNYHGSLRVESRQRNSPRTGRALLLGREQGRLRPSVVVQAPDGVDQDSRDGDPDEGGSENESSQTLHAGVLIHSEGERGPHE